MKVLSFFQKKKKKIIKLKHSFSKAIIKTKSNSTSKAIKVQKKLNESIKKLQIQMPCKCLKNKKLNTNSKSSNLEQNKIAKLNRIRKFNFARSHISNQSIMTNILIACMKQQSKLKKPTLTDQFSSYKKRSKIQEKNG